ncbi:hypothetical protein [Rhodococcus koreensis]
MTTALHRPLEPVTEPVQEPVVADDHRVSANLPSANALTVHEGKR